SVCRSERARLEEQRLGALEQRIDADLELGRHADLVPELEALAGAHPLREHVRGQLMLALYRSGRQADALETYRKGRQLLDEELGLEPREELRELERAILTQDPTIAAPPRSIGDRVTRAAGHSGAWAVIAVAALAAAGIASLAGALTGDSSG